MKERGQQKEPVLLAGNSMLTISIASCLENAGYPFVWDSGENKTDSFDGNQCEIAILVTVEGVFEKKGAISRLEKIVGQHTIIAVNTETIGLDVLQQDAMFPARIVGLNWTEPADTTCFLEIIANQTTDPSCAEQLCQTAIDFWGKDPYVIHGNTGVRMRLLGALIREAFYLVKNGYATVEDIDRACRNDAGYYLPFAGNLRYMDLMGTYAYGMVMKDLNPELSTDQAIPDFFQKMMVQNELGMESGKGFYPYKNGENLKWQELLRKFSFEVQELIVKYPFNYEPTHF